MVTMFSRKLAKLKKKTTPKKMNKGKELGRSFADYYRLYSKFTSIKYSTL